MDVFQSVTAARLVLILGILNLVLIILIYFSCRCLPGSRIGGKLKKYPLYQRFFGKHCYLWALFWPSVVIHAFFAIMLLRWPS